MKFIALMISFFALTAQKSCSSKKTALPDGMYKGRLEKKGICSNYTIQLVEGKMDTSLITASWTNEETGKHYINVFGLSYPCGFPAYLKEGDSFYFTIDLSPNKDCNVCMAYYPAPPRKLAIKVMEKKDE